MRLDDGIFVSFVCPQRGMSPLLQNQLAELTNQKQQQVASGGDKKRRKLVVVSQNCIEPLQALRDGSKEVLLFSHPQITFLDKCLYQCCMIISHLLMLLLQSSGDEHERSECR